MTVDLSFDRFHAALTLALAASVTTLACDKGEAKPDPAAQTISGVAAAQPPAAPPSAQAPAAPPEPVHAATAKSASSAAPAAVLGKQSAAAAPSASSVLATPTKAAAGADAVAREKSCGGVKGCGDSKK